MRRLLNIALSFLAVWCSGQTVTITGTVSNGACAYANGSGHVVLVPQNQQWLVNNTNPVNSPVAINGLDSFGKFSIQLTNTSLIQPASASPQWQFSFCSQGYNNQLPACFTMNAMSLTSSQDISTQIQAQSAPVPGCGGTGLVLETNDVLNGSQALLDLKNGTGISITDNGVGGVTVASTLNNRWSSLMNPVGV